MVSHSYTAEATGHVVGAESFADPSSREWTKLLSHAVYMSRICGDEREV
jgi:hypothetical protein